VTFSPPECFSCGYKAYRAGAIVVKLPRPRTRGRSTHLMDCRAIRFLPHGVRRNTKGGLAPALTARGTGRSPSYVFIRCCG
jgi:hypothetical protein